MVRLMADVTPTDMPDAETVRGWWEDLINGVRTRDEVHGLAAVWLEGDLLVDDPLADSALFDLHGANLTRARDGSIGPGGEGSWVHAIDDLKERYESFADRVRFRAEDPEGYEGAVEAARRARRDSRTDHSAE